MRRTSALPTIAASADSVTDCTCAALEMPNPTAIGSSVTSRSLVTRPAISGASARSPVIPARAKRYTNPGRGRHDLLGPRERRRRRDQKARRDPALAAGRQQHARLLERRIGENEPVKPRVGGLGHKLRSARPCGARSTRSPSPPSPIESRSRTERTSSKDRLGRRAALQRDVHGRGDDRPVGDRVRERNPDLDDAGPGGLQRGQNLSGGTRARVPAADKRHQGPLPLLPERREDLLNAVHGLEYCPTVPEESNGTPWPTAIGIAWTRRAAACALADRAGPVRRSRRGPAPALRSGLSARSR
jgi:hypothetical protein